MTTKFNEIPTHGPRGDDGAAPPSGGSEGPGRESVTARDPLPPSISDDSYESLYRRMWEDHYGDDYLVETEIDPPRPWTAWGLFTAGIAVCSVIVLLHLIGVWIGWWD